MIIIKDLAAIPGDKPGVITVGNFDGVHRGHQLLIREVVERAQLQQANAIVVTFDPHTRTVLQPDTVHPVLSTLDEKAAILEKMGVEYLVVINFTKAVAALSGAEFVERVLVTRLRAIEWVMGSDHTFGANKSGNTNFVHLAGGKNHIKPFIANKFALDNTTISSTAIRAGIIAGRLGEAVALLGHPYLIRANRIHGVQKGRTLGFPTINFSLPLAESKVLPIVGVYAGELEYGDTTWFGALYFGNCPSFTGRDYHFEMFLFNFSGNDPVTVGSTANLWLHKFIRSDKTFASEQELTVQIKHDVETINHIFLEERRYAFDEGKNC